VDKTSWHQKDVRSGFAFEPGFFSVYVKKSGNYEIILRRWPKESKLPLNAAINDGRPSEKYWDELIDGKKMDFKFAYLILDEKEKKTEVKPEDHESRFTVYMSAGKKNLETGFYLDDDSKTTAFYTEVNLIESK
jgi:hypothetical protein